MDDTLRMDAPIKETMPAWKDERERFLNLINYPDKYQDCWTWLGSTHKKGYGYFWYNKKMGKAHRFSYELFINKIPEGLWVLHHCDNPSCVNPDHLFLGTNSDNVKDKVIKGRQYKPKGILNNHAKLKEKDVLKIRFLLKMGKKATDICKIYNVQPKAITQIKTKKYWSHL